VTAIAQTPDGYLWAGTCNGVARFDGVRFVTFDPANTPALGHARVRKLFVDRRGTLWINTYDGSLTTLREGRFTPEIRNFQFSEGELKPSTRDNASRCPGVFIFEKCGYSFAEWSLKTI
jgi:ligand-binding sensor domain-containing protein